MPEVVIEDHHFIARYCKASVIRQGLPSSDAFYLRKNESYLSVNWLEYFGELTKSQAIEYVRQAFLDKGYRIRLSGRFVSLQISQVKNIISRHSHQPASIVHLPGKRDPSHCGVYGYTGHAATDEFIALKISRFYHESCG